ncbi:hypothetical protein BAUCODRAFT_488182 [Baudoinia panamericana UAMH 10762]|uniref:Uncharacterized protein n=1 Tax=Baudoinia panamericana (strain UAMH 10762) TaxID=717646 RepID=M2NC44_BAUPA|nr:uncharacterized protein BAUCODRAFT_488182 [Baudoinia panamericana UAMH 10762]EMC96744.1 hypothetical protein BAUCODRAFT_488182 [Baudoinia panamericana UAMH 10762]
MSCCTVVRSLPREALLEPERHLANSISQARYTTGDSALSKDNEQDNLHLAEASTAPVTQARPGSREAWWQPVLPTTP